MFPWPPLPRRPVEPASAGEALPAEELAAGIELQPGEPVAVKVFKTTLNEFKNRTDYIEGDWRFRHCKLEKHNPRKIVKLCA